MRKIIVAIVLVGAVACGSKKADKDKSKADDPAKTAESAKMPNDRALAFGLGQKMGYVDAFQMLKKADKAQDDLNDAKEIASALGIDAPHMPADGEDEAIDIARQLKAKKNDNVVQAFILGNRLRVAWFGAKIGAKIGGQLDDVEAAATKLGIPESEWRTRFDLAKQKSDADALDQLSDGLETYLEAH